MSGARILGDVSAAQGFYFDVMSGRFGGVSVVFARGKTNDNRRARRSSHATYTAPNSFLYTSRPESLKKIGAILYITIYYVIFSLEYERKMDSSLAAAQAKQQIAPPTRVL